MLRMIAGLEDISAGEIYINDVLVNDLPPKDRDISTAAPQNAQA
jgi:multiple sugar transport system ATP-binding protein